MPPVLNGKTLVAWTINSEEATAGPLKPEVGKCCVSSNTASRCSGDEALANEIRLIGLFDGVTLFAHNLGQRDEANGTAVALRAEIAEQCPVNLVETSLINAELRQGPLGNGVRNTSGPFDLGDVTDATQ